MPRKRPHELRGPVAGPGDTLRPELPVVTHQPAPFRGHERHRRLIATIGLEAANGLAQWSTACRATREALRTPGNDWAEIIGPHARDVLDDALATLPPREARTLGRRVHRLDAMFLDRTLQNPQADPDLPWWYRRTARG